MYTRLHESKLKFTQNTILRSRKDAAGIQVRFFMLLTTWWNVSFCGRYFEGKSFFSPSPNKIKILLLRGEMANVSFKQLLTINRSTVCKCLFCDMWMGSLNTHAHPTFIHAIVKDALIIFKLVARVWSRVSLVSYVQYLCLSAGFAKWKSGVSSFPRWRLSSGSSRSGLQLLGAFSRRFGT